MGRRLVLIALLSLVGILATMFGPFVIRLLTEIPVEFRAMQELARRQRYREEHPPEPPLSSWPEGFLRAAAARTVRVYRLSPVQDTACAGQGSVECFQGHPIVGNVPAQGMDWGLRFLAEVMRMATAYADSEDLKPRFGIRFIGVTDTTDFLLDTTDSLHVVEVALHWKDFYGNARLARGHMPFPFEGARDADSTVQLLRRMPLRIDPPVGVVQEGTR